jgi:penicillin-binding protein 1A
VAKLLCLGVPYDPTLWDSEADYEADCRRTTIWRKLREVPYSLALELRYTKDEILTIYLNRVYLGAGTRGMEAASQRYFGRSAAEVRPAEAAMLAGLLSRRPITRRPQPARSRARAATVLRLMHEQGYLTDEEYDLARLAPAELSDAAAASIGAISPTG